MQLTRSTQNGEYYIMSPPTTMAGDNGSKWRPHMCDMIIYDEEADKHVRIAWEEALAATMIDPAGAVDGVAGGGVQMSGGGTTADWFANAFYWAQWNTYPTSDAAGRTVALQLPAGGDFNASTTKVGQFQLLSQRKIPYIIVCRPFSAPPRSLPHLPLPPPPHDAPFSALLVPCDSGALSHPRVVA